MLQPSTEKMTPDSPYERQLSSTKRKDITTECSPKNGHAENIMLHIVGIHPPPCTRIGADPPRYANARM